MWWRSWGGWSGAHRCRPERPVLARLLTGPVSTAPEGSATKGRPLSLSSGQPPPARSRRAHPCAAPPVAAPARPPAGQALSLMMYTLVGLGSTALVLSITFPQVLEGLTGAGAGAGTGASTSASWLCSAGRRLDCWCPLAAHPCRPAPPALTPHPTTHHHRWVTGGTPCASPPPPPPPTTGRCAPASTTVPAASSCSACSGWSATPATAGPAVPAPPNPPWPRAPPPPPRPCHPLSPAGPGSTPTRALPLPHLTTLPQNAERTETFKVKMVTSDDERSTDIVVEGALCLGRGGGVCGGKGRQTAAGSTPASHHPARRPCITPTTHPPHNSTAGDDEEIERFWKELGLNEKGKVLVKGLLG